MKTAKIFLVPLFGAFVLASCSGSDDGCYDLTTDSEMPAAEEAAETN